MRFSIRASLLLILVATSFAWGQESRKASNESGPPSLELKLVKSPRWTGNCLELDFQRRNVSKSPIFLNPTYGGVKIYLSVRDATKVVGEGSGESWMLVYGWTDVVSEAIELGPGKKQQDIVCIAETFAVKRAGKETFRQVRVQGTLRIVGEYEIPTWKTIYRPQGDGREDCVRTVDKSDRWTFREVVLETPVPCPNGTDASDCFSPSEILAGEHDIHTIEPESPPEIETEPLQLQAPIFPVDRPIPPRPQ